MKIWFDNEGTAFGGKKYFAVIEEFLVDKDGAPVITAQQNEAAAENTQVNNENAELIAKVDKIIDDVAERSVTTEKTVEKTTEITTEKASEVINETVNEVVNETIKETVSEHNAEHNVEHNVIHNIERSVVNEADEQPAEEVAAADAPAEEVTAVDEVVSDEADVNVNVAAIDMGADETAEETAAAPDVNVVAVVPAVNAEVAVGVDGAEVKAPVRSRNFAEKMRDADEVMQDRYDELKNYALRFRKLKARISKKFDSINAGRFQFVKLSIAGKTLKLYLNMDINTTDPKYHCKDMSDKKTYVTVPVLLRIKSGRAVKYAKRLIDQCAEQHGMLERRKPFVVDAMALIEEALAAKEGKNVDDGDEEINDVAVTVDEADNAEE
ncbi:MAG: hypothetical protein SOX77_01985 [Candidatus Borkfalkiaceae bacterium]|nr:hypothetical protein [Christensenellaceae bacterium]